MFLKTLSWVEKITYVENQKRKKYYHYNKFLGEGAVGSVAGIGPEEELIPTVRGHFHSIFWIPREQAQETPPTQRTTLKKHACLYTGRSGLGLLKEKTNREDPFSRKMSAHILPKGILERKGSGG